MARFLVRFRAPVAAILPWPVARPAGCSTACSSARAWSGFSVPIPGRPGSASRSTKRWTGHGISPWSRKVRSCRARIGRDACGRSGSGVRLVRRQRLAARRMPHELLCARRRALRDRATRLRGRRTGRTGLAPALARRRPVPGQAEARGGSKANLPGAVAGGGRRASRQRSGSSRWRCQNVAVSLGGTAPCWSMPSGAGVVPALAVAARGARSARRQLPRRDSHLASGADSSTALSPRGRRRRGGDALAPGADLCPSWIVTRLVRAARPAAEQGSSATSRPRSAPASAPVI